MILLGTGWETERSRGNPEDSTERLWDVQEGFGRDGEMRFFLLHLWMHCGTVCGNWAGIPSVSTGGHPAAPPKQRRAGGVSLEGEAGGITGRIQRSMYLNLAGNHFSIEYQITKVLDYCIVCSFHWIFFFFFFSSLDEPESHSAGAGDWKTNR